MVTLVGPGGVGKTRLALEVARAAAARRGMGVRIVELARLDDGEDVLAAVVAELGLASEQASSPEALQRGRQPRRARGARQRRARHRRRRPAPWTSCCGADRTCGSSPRAASGSASTASTCGRSPRSAPRVPKRRACRLFVERARAAVSRPRPGRRRRAASRGSSGVSTGSPSPSRWPPPSWRPPAWRSWPTPSTSASMPSAPPVVTWPSATAAWPPCWLGRRSASRRTRRRSSPSCPCSPGRWRPPTSRACSGDAEAADIARSLAARSLVSVDRSTSPARFQLLLTVRDFASRKLAETGRDQELADRHAGWFLDAAAQADAAAAHTRRSGRPPPHRGDLRRAAGRPPLGPRQRPAPRRRPVRAPPAVRLHPPRR